MVLDATGFGMLRLVYDGTVSGTAQAWACAANALVRAFHVSLARCGTMVEISCDPRRGEIWAPFEEPLSECFEEGGDPWAA